MVCIAAIQAVRAWAPGLEILIARSVYYLAQWQNMSNANDTSDQSLCFCLGMADDIQGMASRKPEPYEQQDCLFCVKMHMQAHPSALR